MSWSDVLYGHLILFTLLFVFARGCYVNDCLCYDARIVCEITDEASPVFTESERFVANELYLTVKQSQWITRQCAIFPRITKLIMMDGSRCPPQACVPCRR